MSIRIKKEACVGCLKCIKVCPGSLIKEKDNRAYIKYPKDCWGCVSCVKECKFDAIDFYLGADIGGNASTMNVSYEGDILHWKIKKSDGTVKTIDVFSKDSNKY